MKQLNNYVNKSISNKIKFNINKHNMDFIYNDVDAYDNGIDFEIEIKNNQVINIKFKSQDIKDWKELK